MDMIFPLEWHLRGYVRHGWNAYGMFIDAAGDPEGGAVAVDYALLLNERIMSWKSFHGKMFSVCQNGLCFCFFPIASSGLTQSLYTTLL